MRSIAASSNVSRFDRAEARVTFNSLVCVESRCCDPQNPADRPDTEDASMFFDKGNRRLNGRSRATAAKYADAFLRSSSAVPSSRFSGSNSSIRSFSTRVSPARSPASRSACRYQPEDGGLRCVRKRQSDRRGRIVSYSQGSSFECLLSGKHRGGSETLQYKTPHKCSGLSTASA